MSKIEKALERAKNKRHAVQQEFQGQVPPEEPRSGEQDPVYTQTKVVSLDTGHLEKHRLMTLLDDPEAMELAQLAMVARHNQEWDRAESLARDAFLSAARRPG